MLFKLTNAGDNTDLVSYAESIKERTIIDVLEKTKINRFEECELNIYIDMASIEDVMIISELLGFRVVIGRSISDDEPQLCIYDDYLE